MDKKLILVILVITLSLPVYAVDCNKKPCHKKCIDNQSQEVKTQCWCKSRKLIYYHYGRYIGMPEYNEVCDGTFDQYVNKYCNNKRQYDRQMMIVYPNDRYIPEYDEVCDGSYEAYYQRLMQLEQIRAVKALSMPRSIDINHSGTVNHDVNQTVRFNGSVYPHYGY